MVGTSLVPGPLPPLPRYESGRGLGGKTSWPYAVDGWLHDTLGADYPLSHIRHRNVLNSSAKEFMWASYKKLTINKIRVGQVTSNVHQMPDSSGTQRTAISDTVINLSTTRTFWQVKRAREGYNATPKSQPPLISDTLPNNLQTNAWGIAAVPNRRQ